MRGPSISLRTLRSGFTFIELLVGVTLLLLLTGLLVAGYNGFNNSQLVLQAAATLKNNLRAIRTDAASGVKPTGCDQLIGYEVDFQSTSAYTSSAVCFVSGTKQLVGISSAYALPQGVQFASIPSQIIFYSTNSGASVDETIQLVGANKTASIAISSSGTVGDFIPTPTP